MAYPPPTNFKEGQRALYGRYLVAAGVAIGIGAAILTGILAFGGWPEERYEQIIDYLGYALIGAGVLLALVIALLGPGGPMRSLKASWGKASIETEGE